MANYFKETRAINKGDIGSLDKLPVLFFRNKQEIVRLILHLFQLLNDAFLQGETSAFTRCDLADVYAYSHCQVSFSLLHTQYTMNSRQVLHGSSICGVSLIPDD